MKRQRNGNLPGGGPSPSSSFASSSLQSTFTGGRGRGRHNLHRSRGPFIIEHQGDHQGFGALTGLTFNEERRVVVITGLQWCYQSLLVAPTEKYE